MKFFVITGQTSTGKTKLALEYAKKYNGELINCDSRQIYKYLDIITGKDISDIANSKFKIVNRLDNFDIGYYQLLISTNFNELQRISTKIWLYDVVDPKSYFSSYDWKQCALTAIKDITSRRKTPIIVGGTYLYLKHLLYGVKTENIPPNWQLRKELESKSVAQLQKKLKNLFPQIFNQLNQSDRENPQRLIRKIEIAYYFTSNNLSNLTNLPNLSTFNQTQYQIIGLKFKDKKTLISAIKKRVEERLKKGAIEEVETLLKKGYTEADPGLKTIGYQQIIAYLKGKLTKEEAINQWTTAEIQYAKRQYTFMKKDPNIRWKIVTSNF